MPKKKKVALEGVCHFHSESGTEGGFWAFQDKKYMTPDRWSYEGLHILNDGDKLTILSPNNLDLVVWSGIIQLIHYCHFTESICGFWMHSDQVGIDRETWAMYFLNEYPAKLVKNKKP